MSEFPISDLEAAGIPRRHIMLIAGRNDSLTTSTTQGGGFWEFLKEMFLSEEDNTPMPKGCAAAATSSR